MQNNGSIEDGDPVALDEGERPALADDAVWHAGWVIGVAAGGALLLVTLGVVSHPALWALGLIAAPGVVGALWRPKAQAQIGLLTLWALAATASVTVSGGLSGPLTVFCAAPVIVCLCIGGAWPMGVGLSLAAAAGCALLGLLHLGPLPPAEPTRTGLTLIALLMTTGAVGGALLISHRRAEDEREDLQAELEAFQSLMGDLPELALAMDAYGRTQAVFGQPLQGLPIDDLHAGLINVAAPVDRPAVQAAIDEALDRGAALVVFALAAAEGRRIAGSLQRTSLGGLTAILRPAPTTRPAPAGGEHSPELARRLTDAEAARQAAEEGRSKAEANASARTRFLANMSHELRTPLNAIMGFSDMMRTRVFGELPPKYAEYAELIHESGGHLLELINDVLDMSKIEAQRYTLVTETFDVREPLSAALRLMRLQADEAGVKLRGVLPDEPLTVEADRRAIKQMALNLLSNAVKFTPRDGTVILTARAAGEALEIIVADTGLGIAEEDLKRIGQPFEQAGDVAHRAQGTGLGLALVEAFAKLHGGTMTLESRLGEGTAATVRMPVLAAVEAPPVVEAARMLEAEDVAALQPPPALAEPPAPEPASAHDGAGAAAPGVEPVAFAPVQPPASEPGLNGSKPALDSLGPLDARAHEHNGLRQSVLGIFRSLGVHPETGEPLPEPPHDPARPGNHGIRVQG